MKVDPHEGMAFAAMNIEIKKMSAAPNFSAEERRRFEDVGFMTCMTLVLLGNYAQTGHFGGPLAYTPFNVTAHLLGSERGGRHYDHRQADLRLCQKCLMPEDDLGKCRVAL